MMNKSSLPDNKRYGIDTQVFYSLIYTMFKFLLLTASVAMVYITVFTQNTLSYKNMFQEILTGNIFPFNLYPDIAAVEVCIGTLLLPFLLFSNDRYEEILFSIRFKLVYVLGLSLGILLVPMALLETFYRNPGFISGLGYAGLHLLLNAGSILGLAFSPILYITGICSCYMIKTEKPGDIIESEVAASDEDNTVIDFNKYYLRK